MIELTLQRADAYHGEIEGHPEVIGTIWINQAAICAIVRRVEGGSTVYLLGGQVVDVSESAELLLRLMLAQELAADAKELEREKEFWRVRQRVEHDV